MQVPAAIRKVRRAPKKRRPLIALRETVRMAGRVKFGPLWNIGEKIANKIGGLFRKRRRRRRQRRRHRAMLEAAKK